jgi:hypothetical protein
MMDVSVAQVADSLKIVEQARGQIQNSQNLKRILEIVLAFGNYMNDKCVPAASLPLNSPFLSFFLVLAATPFQESSSCLTGTPKASS